tara:strand:- start:421 stop:729 length:309 start_codon:yes stop_codon:yes gene_type:complete
MSETPKEKIIFRTEEGDYNVSLFSAEGKLHYTVAQKAIQELKDLTAEMLIRKGAISSLHASLQSVECTEATLIVPLRARTKGGQYIADDPSTPDINEAYKED